MSPDVSVCSRMPVSPRPASTATSAWPPSCAIVTTTRVHRQNADQVTATRASTAASSTPDRCPTSCSTVRWSVSTASPTRPSLARSVIGFDLPAAGDFRMAA
ncbi:hypothetical protein BJF78_08630 [Pseudonocardia sp. CNS-139]|nr:hypothetical protein BJF78_08630 [Pseudonocardia sp. CNS-139]